MDDPRRQADSPRCALPHAAEPASIAARSSTRASLIPVSTMPIVDRGAVGRGAAILAGNRVEREVRPKLPTRACSPASSSMRRRPDDADPCQQEGHALPLLRHPVADQTCGRPKAPDARVPRAGRRPRGDCRWCDHRIAAGRNRHSRGGRRRFSCARQSVDRLRGQGFRWMLSVQAAIGPARDP